MAVAFFKRHPGYQVGILCLYLVTVLFYVSNFTPQWLHYSVVERNVPIKGGVIRYREVHARSSVLTGCEQKKENGTYNSGGFFSAESDGCGTGFYIDSKGGGWVHACQAFEIIGALALLLACVYTVRVNFCKAEPGPRKRYVEMATIAAGGLGFLGAVIFAGKLSSTVHGSDHYGFAWALFFTIVISIVVVVDGVLIAVFNKPNDSYENIN